MATRAQANAAITAAATNAINDINNLLPANVVIKDGAITFGPSRTAIILDAGGSAVQAESWLADITANMDAASRTYTVRRSGRRESDPKGYVIVIAEAIFQVNIINFSGTP